MLGTITHSPPAIAALAIKAPPKRIGGELRDRAKLERLFERGIRATFGDQSEELFRQLGDPPDVANVSPEFWRSSAAGLAFAVQPLLARAFTEQAASVAGAIGIGIDPAVIGDEAARWAMQNAAQLVTGINATTQRTLAQQIAAFWREGLTMGELRDRIMATPGHAFDAVRARMIAITETTRAATEGNLWAADRMRALGLTLQPYWLTMNDELVCPICGPLNGQAAVTPPGARVPLWESSVGTIPPPPAHPNCRCVLQHQLVR